MDIHTCDLYLEGGISEFLELEKKWCAFPLILIKDMAIIILEVIIMKEQECKEQCGQKQAKNVEFAKEIFNNETKKTEKQNKEKQ